ncbi:hypothetical protein O1611_g7460 [Lasiodiplodia mahajangana]|uniref:Uncharacterized protein n=1 Tax=Lasiodiplodia mahajangana TaxID=1108764 RepID=A0ACC2JFI6_9PEZI|nr:hypothetical protein O1611_g7460 [Lasiodiplodia mahajangana]
MAGVYQELDPEKQEIRLLHLFPAINLESSIRCRLIQVPLADHPKYECLSYVWGNHNFTVAIELNEQEHFITPSLDLALRHIRLPEEIRIIWVDAVCINQADLVERGRQVSLMKEIYKNCQVDLAWLCMSEGPGHPAKIADGLKLMDEICKKDVQLGDKEWRPWNTDPKPYSRAYGMAHEGADFVDEPRRPTTFVHRQDDLDILPENFESHIFLLEDTFQYSHFWNRIWIVQELACSPEVVLIGPNVNLDWRAISAYLGRGRYEEALDRSRTAITGHSPALITYFGYVFEKAKTIEYQRSIVREINKGGRASLMDSLVRFRCTSSTDPRDKIYALLGIVSEPHDIIPDYHKSKEQLFAEVSLTLINTSKTLDIIC